MSHLAEDGIKNGRWFSQYTTRTLLSLGAAVSLALLLVGPSSVAAATPQSGTLTGPSLAAARAASLIGHPPVWVTAQPPRHEAADALDVASGAQPDVICCDGFTAPAPELLGADQQQQLTQSYCGPTSAAETLGDLGVGISQSTAAGYLDTTESEGTAWGGSDSVPDPKSYGYGASDSPITHLLNYEIREWYYGPVQLPPAPTSAQVTTYEWDLVDDVVDLHPVVAGLYMEYSPMLPGWPSGIYYHWIVLRGYYSYGATTAYEDSATDMDIYAGWHVDAYNTISSPTLAVIMGDFGYIW